MITRKEILKWFIYDRKNGELIWKSHWNKSTESRLKGKIAGNIRRDSHTYYKSLMLKQKTYLIHRIISFLEIGVWSEQVDHIDGNGLNNKFSNLRASTQHKNQRNRSIHRAGRKPGYHLCKTTNQWRAQITINKKRIHLGRYSTEFEAHYAYSQAVKKYGV